MPNLDLFQNLGYIPSFGQHLMSRGPALDRVSGRIQPRGNDVPSLGRPVIGDVLGRYSW